MSKQIQSTEAIQLDQIRQAEAEITRRIAAAHETAKLTEIEALAEAKKLKSEAKNTGTRDGQAQGIDIISRAKEEAELLIAQSRTRAEKLHQGGQIHIDDVVKHAVNIVLGVSESEIKR